MCGLCGVAGPGIQKWDVDNFRELLYVTALRGQQGTGVLRIPYQSGQRPEMSKTVYDASYFLNMDANAKNPIIHSVSTLVYMGHCRSPTKGAVVQANSHPFDTGRYISAHNGTLSDKKYQSKEKTDSEMMFKDMEKRGIESVLSSLSYTSAYAVSIWDKKERELTLTRNADRGLFGVFMSRRDVFYWASEFYMLKLILARNNESHGDIMYLQPETIYSIDPMEISHKKGWNNWNIEENKRQYFSKFDNIDWPSVLDEERKKLEGPVEVEPKTAASIPEDQIPNFLKNPKSHQPLDLDCCFRCKKPLAENESFTCRECRTEAAKTLGSTHDVQSTDERMVG